MNPSPQHKTRVELGDRAYDILIGENLLAKAGSYIGPLLNRSRTVIITDENVAPLHLDVLCASLRGDNIDYETIILPPGEGTKSFSMLENLLDRLLELRLERTDMIIALGGGVTGDLCGFAASIYLRGIDFIQIPTTLLAQVDSSVGGKTGINSVRGKNLIGAFHQPRLVLADVKTLETLPRRDFLSGYAEVVKYGLIDDAPFFTWLEENGPALINGDNALRAHAILKSCKAKARIVAQDEKEHGARALLNLGHTFGHALEAENAFSGGLYHGEAVAIGMLMAFELSEKRGHMATGDVTRVRDHLKNVGLPVDKKFNFQTEKLIHHVQGDKKARGGQVTFILANAIGESFQCRDVDLVQVENIFKGYMT